MPWLRSFFVFPILTLFAIGCSSTEKGGKKEAEPSSPKSTAHPPKQVHFFLETSASMGGYLKGKTEFKDVVANLIAVLGGDAIPDSIWTISENPLKYNDSPQNFGRTLATTKLASGRSSQLHKIFEKVADQAGNRNVSILVSDCILSFSDAEIKKNREINRDNASSTLKSDIKQTFAKLKNKNIGATLYAFQSAFNGDYYDYHNTKKNISEKQRPFYVWVIGHRDVIGTINKLLQEDAGFKPMQVMDFGAGMTQPIAKVVLFDYNKAGKWKPEAGNENTTLKKVDVSDDPAQFAVSIDLSSLPIYVQDPKYLKENLKVDRNKADLQIMGVEKVEQLKLEKLKKPEQERLFGKTHVITFSLKNLLEKEIATTVKLPLQFDTWYHQWSTDDDTTLSQRQAKTFAFKYLVEGTKEAFESDAKNYFSITLTFKQ